MNQFKDNELPLGELEKLGLYIQGRILLSRDNINALLTGRRTEMTNFKDLKFDGLSIPELDAKLSLKMKARNFKMAKLTILPRSKKYKRVRSEK